MRRRVFLSGVFLAGVGLPVLAGCKVPWQSKGQAGSASASASAGGSAAVPAASAAPQGWQELDAHVMGHHLGFQVSPLVRRDEKTTVLALKLTRAKDDASVKEASDAFPNSGKNVFEASSPLSRPGLGKTFDWGANGVRLLDLPTNRAWVATDSIENKVEDNYNDLSLKPGESTSCFVLFGPVDAKQVTVFVPQSGFVTVNVLDSSAAAASGIDFKAMDKAFKNVDNLNYNQYKTAPNPALASPVAIERYTKALDDSTSTHTGSKDITVTLASDVTFASDSADLTSAADAQLKTVAGQLAQYPDGGTLTIVGHTDDVQDDAYNQTLSEKRANAVKTRLAQLTSLDKWQTSVSGKGESEPRINDTTDEARAVNRRVEITLTPTGGTTPKNTTPAPNLHRWFGDKEVVFSNSRGEDGSDEATIYAADGLTLLAGGERIYPADYRDADFKTHVPLTELALTPFIKAGTTTICVVWPDPGGDTITLDHAAPRKEVAELAFRLTDIPVKNN